MTNPSLSTEQRAALRRRIERQLRAEVEGDVDAWVAIIDPQLVAKRIRERDDEPELIRRELGEFVRQIESAALVGFEIPTFEPETAERFARRPVALAETLVRYNDAEAPTPFRTLWVLDGDEWYTRAIGKRRRLA